MTSPTLSTYTVAQLTQLYTDNRSSVLNDIVTSSHTIILAGVACGKTSIMIDHILLHSEWMKEAQFVTDLQSTLSGLFPGSTITIAAEEPGPYRISFSYTPV